MADTNMSSINDRQAFEIVMEIMGMVVAKRRNVDDGELVIYYDTYKDSPRFQKCGYDEFCAGAIFDSQGKIVKGYIDSHVAYSSDFRKELDSMADA